MDEETITIHGMIKEYGLKKIILSYDCMVSLLLGFILSLSIFALDWTEKAIEVLVPVFVPTAGVFITVVIAGLAIVVSMADPDFIRILKKANVFNKLLIIFYLSAIISGSCIVINIVTLLLKQFTDSKIVLITFLALSIFTFIYSLLSVITVVGTTVKFGVYRGLFLDLEPEKLKEVLSKK